MDDTTLEIIRRSRDAGEQRLLAIQYITEGRIEDATRTLARLVDVSPPTRGRCQFCGCTDDRGCAVYAADPTGVEEHLVIRCQWIDVEHTVCSNVHCIEAWRRLRPEALQTSAGEEPRIVLP